MKKFFSAFVVVTASLNCVAAFADTDSVDAGDLVPAEETQEVVLAAEFEGFGIEDVAEEAN